MIVRRIVKTSGALFGGQGVNLISQFVLPPLFLATYGVARYGEWLTLSAAVSYLATLNFGLQTFANNQAGIAYSRGDADEVNEVQGTALLILSAIVAVAALLTSLLFVLPIASWLDLHQVSNFDAALTMYLLGGQVLSRMLFGFFGGCFLVVGVAYRGQNWNSVQALVSFLVTAGAIRAGLGFVGIAALQFLSVLVFTVAALVDLHRLAPEVVPHLRYARKSRIRAVLKPSGYFALLFSSNFLVYQFPVLLMNRILGPAQVVVFSITRTVFSMSRQFLSSMSQAIGPEIVELYGRSNWRMLHRLYDVSERAVFALTPLVSVGTFAIAPFVLAIWLHKPELYNINICFLMALVSAVIGTKEHKSIFQTSANEHSQMSRFVFLSYIAMVAATVPALKMFGLNGFLAVWLITEVVQMFYILRLNQQMFAHFTQLDMKYVYRLAGLLVTASAACFYISVGGSQSAFRVLSLTAVAMLTLLAVTYPLFDVRELHGNFFSRFSRRAQPES